MTKERDPNVVDILIKIAEKAYGSQQITDPEIRRQAAMRDIDAVLDLNGGRKWYFPRKASFEADARASRDEAIRQAHRRSVPRPIILRTFRISKTQFYRILAAG
jgi:Mor family transcriptional regulator